MGKLRWTTDIPEQKGWYWHQGVTSGKLAAPLMICVTSDGTVVGHSVALIQVEDLGGRFAGPIPEPEDAP